MNGTGVLATSEQVEELKKLAKEAANTPLIAFGYEHAMRDGMAGDARRRVQETCHKFALEAGLPEIKGFYGCNLETGEFLKHEDN